MPVNYYLDNWDEKTHREIHRTIPWTGCLELNKKWKLSRPSIQNVLSLDLDPVWLDASWPCFHSTSSLMGRSPETSSLQSLLEVAFVRYFATAKRQAPQIENDPHEKASFSTWYYKSMPTSLSSDRLEMHFFACLEVPEVSRLLSFNRSEI